MNDLIFILGKSYLCGLFLYLFYSFLIKKESYFILSRIYLNLTSFLLIILFLLDVNAFSISNLFSSGENNIAFINLPEVVIGENSNSNNEFHSFILDYSQLFYWSVVSIFALTFLTRIISLIRFIKFVRTSEMIYQNVCKAKCGSPFSVFGKIYIPESYLHHPNLQQILKHEQAHINQKHQYDTFSTELIACFLWFNPFIFLIKKEIRKVHEYLADQEVIENEVDISQYQATLLNESIGLNPHIFQNNFNSNLKRRIVMLVKKSSRKAAIRIMVALPVLITGLALIIIMKNVSATPPIPTSNISPIHPIKINKVSLPPTSTIQSVNYANIQQKPSKPNANKKDSVYTQVEVLPEYPGGDAARNTFIIKNIKYPEKAKMDSIQGVVYVSFIVEANGKISNVKVLRGIGSGCDEEAIRVIKLMPNWKPGKTKGKPVKTQLNLPIKFVLDNKK